MRRIAFLAPLMLVACTTTHGETALHGETSGHKCDIAHASSLIGQPGTSETGAAIMKATNSAILRWAWPNSAVTMDFRLDRVTVILSPDGKVSKIDCG